MPNLYQYNGKKWVQIAKDGKNATVDYDFIISQIPKPADGLDGADGKDGSPDTRLQIVEKINTGKKNSLKIERKQIEGLEKLLTQEELDRAIAILDQRTQFLINKTTRVVTDATLTGDGSSESPLHAVGDGMGDMLKATYDPGNVNGNAFDYNNFINTPTNISDFVNDTGFITDLSSFTTANLADSSNKRYVTDAQLTLLGNTSGVNSGDVTVTDSSEIDFTLAGQNITAVLKAGSIDESKLDASVNASLDLADTALQSGDNISELVNDSGYVTSSGVTSVSGTLNRITSTGGATPVIDISASYVGQSSITTLGTITTGVWNGTAIANANLANSSITIGSTAISLGASSTTLAGLTSVTSTTFVGALTGNASTATALATGRTIAITGDLSYTSGSFDGTGNVTGTGTLASIISAGGPTGSATVAPIITYDAKGRLTAVSSATITPAVGSITGLGTGVATALGVNVGSAGAFVTFNGALGTPSSGTVTNLTGTAGINITGTAPAGMLTGTTLNATVVTSSLTTIGTLVAGTVPAPRVSAGTFGTGAYTMDTSLTVPTIYGSSASGGNLLFQSTSNATKGLVAISSTSTGLIYDEVNNVASIGVAPLSTAKLYVQNNSSSGSPTLLLENIGDGAGNFHFITRRTGAGNASIFRMKYYDDGNTLVEAATFGASIQNIAAATRAGNLFFATQATAGTTATSRMFLTYLGNLKVGTSTIVDRGTTEGTNHIDIFNGTAPVGTLANGISLFSASGKLKSADAAGTVGHVLSGSAVNVVSPTAPNRTITVDIGGTTYYISAKTTND